jgi:hypothetical protein
VRGLLALAVGVEGLGQFADAGLLLGRSDGERERLEAAGLVVAWTVFQRAGCRQRPDDMHAAGQHAEGAGVVERDAPGREEWSNRETGIRGALP